MKSIFKLTLLVLSIVFATDGYAAEPPKRVPVSYRTAYVPNGFDSNDNVQIVAEGLFQSSCYRPAETKVEIDQASRVIYLGPAAYLYSGMCLQLVLPFDRVIDVGILRPGEYKVVQMGDRKLLGEFDVHPSLTNDPDDYLYAPINQAFFVQRGLNNAVFLTGTFTNSCMNLVDIKVNVEKKTIVIQPISEMQRRNDCVDGKFNFEKRVDLPHIPRGRYLLHVRSLNAKAINTLIDVK